MKKIIIVSSIIVVIIVATIVLLVTFRSHDEQGAEADVREKGDEINIKYPSGVSISIPKDWEIRGGEKIEDGLYASKQMDNTRSQIWLTSKLADVFPTVDEVKKAYPLYSLFVDTSGGAIEYYGRSSNGKFTYTSSGEAGEITPELSNKNNDYIEGKIVFSNGNLIEVGCYVVGPQYGEHISLCSSIVDSLTY
ncbi:MAG: hypothetical protein UX31_C0005G0005 [Candidatus Nomurabacteria bacterium GW2011_GWA1_46_11]|uniref:Uncharacterized protein n=2 Tax=Parcubacteria group TaxID=1794811 RepID=A0A1G1YVV0_9BACT|nr:MAG: hypothetical protein UX29_C0002G0046 [Parcubacteria group bacterium GW2011_GWA2_46_10]KKU22195.1 MAG: hypothetical protein UX31_C0005G0005 [Candidatus Nomurabacteria bacterium GW2011_GWA1_46_11]OGY56505.1 MAG: hypothetical protein A2119_00240 [Candidatus Colwellbacteria bacterium GWA2_46_10]